MILLKPILSNIIESRILEALPISKAKEFASIQKSDEVKSLQDSIFTKLKSLPEYLNSNRNGDRLYFRFESKGEEDSIKSDNTPTEIKDALKSKGFTIKDYKSGIAIDKYDREVKIGKVLQKISPNLLKQFTLDSSRESSKPKERLVVISKSSYDLGGMSTDRGWTSCMSMGAINHTYINCDVKEGTIISYLISSDDLNLKSPQARILIKPFINMKDPKDVIYYPENKVYGTAPSSFSTLISKIFSNFHPKVGKFKMNKSLYNDTNDGDDESKRPDVDFGKKKIDNLEKIILKKIENGETLIPSEKNLNSLMLFGKDIYTLPSGLKIKNVASLANNPNLKSLPDDFQIDGNLWLQNTGILTLPKNLKIGPLFGINLTNTPLSKKYTIDQIKKLYPNILGKIYLNIGE